MAKKAKKLQQGMFFQLPIEPEPEPEQTEIVPFFFDDLEVRARANNGEIWFVAADVCRALEIENVTDAVDRLDDDEKTTLVNNEGGGRAHSLNIISEPGLYALVFGSRKPVAKRFRRWITHVVIPALRKKGYYALPTSPASRVKAMKRRLKCDERTAELRCDQVDINKHTHGRLKEAGATRADYQAWHNNGYDAQFHKNCAELRKLLDLPPSRSPLDRMDKVVLAPNLHAKVLAERIFEEARKAGQPVPIADQLAVFHQMLRQFSADDLKRLGPGYAYGVRDDDRRGKIIDARKMIAADRPGPRA